MEADFWHTRWHKNEIGFHEEDGNEFLKKYLDTLKIPNGARVFVPLCGKTRDIAWLLSKGYSVVGIELNSQAIDQLFEELNVVPECIESNGFERRRALFSNEVSLDVFVGDFFALNNTLLGKVDAVYDRAALVALPPAMRKQYASHLLTITKSCTQLLICFEYADGLLQGPPHCVDLDEVKTHYSNTMHILLLHNEKVEGGFRGQSEVFESVYLLNAI